MKPEKECMLHQRKLVSSIVSLTLPLSDGLEKVKSVILKLVEVSIGTGTSHLKPQWDTQLKTLLLLVDSLSSTQESPRVLNERTLIDRLNISLRTIPPLKSHLISAQVLISTAKGYNPYLKRSIWEQYPLLLFLIKTVCLGLDLNGSSTSVSPMIRNSLFSMIKTSPSNLQEMSLLKTCLQSLIVSPPKCTLIENTQEALEVEKSRNKKVVATKKTNEEVLYKTKKVKIAFSQQNKSLKLQEYLRDMSDLYNVSWNKGVGLLKSLSKPYVRNRTKYIRKNSSPKKFKKTKEMSKGEKKRISREVQKFKRRPNVIKFKCSTFLSNDELKTLEKQIKNKEFRNQKQVMLCNKLMFTDKNVDRAFRNIKSIIQAQKTKKKWFFDLKIRTRRNNRIVTFNARDYKGLKKKFGCINGLEEIKCEFKFLYIKQEKQWYLLTQEIVVPTSSYSEIPRVCSLDPGVREFQKVFSLNEGCVYTIGTKRDIDKICSLKSEMEKAQVKLKEVSQLSRASVRIDSNDKTMRRKKQKLRRLRDLKATKVSNKRKDAHWKLAAFLTDHWDTIILPEFTTQQMMAKKCKLQKVSRKEMRDWGHYMFKEKLRWMCTKKGKTLVDGKEYYTSKTCCCCLTITNTIGSGKNFKCPSCPNNIDRDINGAINNLLIMVAS